MSTNARGRAYIAEETYMTHIQAATDLHRAHMRLITLEQTGTKEEREEADAALWHKRKAADEASDDFIFFVSKAPRNDPICADYVPTSPGCSDYDYDSDSDESDDASPRIGANGAPLPLKWL